MKSGLSLAIHSTGGLPGLHEILSQTQNKHTGQDSKDNTGEAKSSQTQDPQGKSQDKLEALAEAKANTCYCLTWGVTIQLTFNPERMLAHGSSGPPRALSQAFFEHMSVYRCFHG